MRAVIILSILLALSIGLNLFQKFGNLDTTKGEIQRLKRQSLIDSTNNRIIQQELFEENNSKDLEIARLKRLNRNKKNNNDKFNKDYSIFYSKSDSIKYVLLSEQTKRLTNKIQIRYNANK